MHKNQNKVGKVMREFKKGELHSGKSGKIVKNPKQAIAIALSESGQSRKPMAKGGSAVVKKDFMAKHKNQFVNHSDFINKDGYLNGGVDIEVTNPQETQIVDVQGQQKVLPDKRRKAKWY